MDGWIDRYRYIDIDINMDKRYQQQPPINILPLHSVPLVDGINLYQSFKYLPRNPFDQDNQIKKKIAIQKRLLLQK